MISLFDKVKSKTDNTIKYVFKLGNIGVVSEISYINKNDGKDIVCAPTQTSCNMGCKFCHLTGLNVAPISIEYQTIFDMIHWVLRDVSENNIGHENNTLLISYMGAGEPLLNIDGVMRSAMKVYDEYLQKYKSIRFAVASIIPKKELMERFIEEVRDSGLDFKFHLSLHFTDNEDRKSLMPHAIEPMMAINLLNKYANYVGKTEIHYTLIESKNDTRLHADSLIKSVKGINTTVKLLKFSDKKGADDLQRSSREDMFAKYLTDANIKVEMYDPPGRDIGASCGQFNLGRYL